MREGSRRNANGNRRRTRARTYGPWAGNVYVQRRRRRHNRNSFKGLSHRHYTLAYPSQSSGLRRRIGIFRFRTRAVDILSLSPLRTTRLAVSRQLLQQGFRSVLQQPSPSPPSRCAAKEARLVRHLHSIFKPAPRIVHRRRYSSHVLSDECARRTVIARSLREPYDFASTEKGQVDGFLTRPSTPDGVWYSKLYCSARLKNVTIWLRHSVKGKIVKFQQMSLSL